MINAASLALLPVLPFIQEAKLGKPSGFRTRDKYADFITHYNGNILVIECPSTLFIVLFR